MSQRRPLPVTIVAILYIAAGVLGLAYHLPEIKSWHQALDSEVLLGVSVRLLAIVCGVFLLKGLNWARWLAIAWMAFHVALSLFHSREQLIIHVVFLGLISLLLLRRKSAEYFQRTAA